MWIVNLALVFRIPCNPYSTAKVWYVQQKIYVAYDTTLVEPFWITTCYKTKRYLKTLVYNHKFVPTLSIPALYTLLVLPIIQTILMINLSTIFFLSHLRNTVQDSQIHEGLDVDDLIKSCISYILMVQTSFSFFIRC